MWLIINLNILISAFKQINHIFIFLKNLYYVFFFEVVIFRKEELLLEEKELNRIWILRKLLNQMQPLESMEFFTERAKENKTNEDFLNAMSEPVFDR